MKIGCCCPVDDIDLVAKAGYDYIEPNLQQIYFMSDEEFIVAKMKVDASPIKCEAFNCLIPGDFKVVGEDVDYNKNLDYAKKAISRASQLGCQVIVIGSGGARNLPEQFTYEKAQEQFIQFVRMVSDVAKEYNIISVIEPLCKKDCNFINYIPEANEIAKIVERENVKILADLYHMYTGNEDLSHLSQYADLLFYIHIANPIGRFYPALSDEYNYDQFFAELKKIGFDKRISIEADTENRPLDLEKSMELLKYYLSFYVIKGV